MMKYILAITMAFQLLSLAMLPAVAQGQSFEWVMLNGAVIKLYPAGEYDRAVVVAKKALGQLKIKLQQRDCQIEESKRHQAGQFDLFLVINRLEEFAAAVSGRLSAVDFNTKRKIIRALVKRIEIH